MNSGYVSIKGMNKFIFNERSGRYEQVDGFAYKTSFEIADEYDISPPRVRQYAREHHLPYFGTESKVHDYIFEDDTEKAFANRNTKPTGRPAVPKPPKVPGKPGRPRKEKPVDTGPKRPVGRPRKYPAEAMDIVKGPRGRPRKILKLKRGRKK